MGLRQQMAALAVDATHVLVLESPGAWPTRVAIEREVNRRGWRLALSPADADAVVVAGIPGPQLSERIEAVWAQLPGPRSRTVVPSCADSVVVCDALDAVAAELLDTDRQVRDAREREGFASDPMGGDSSGGNTDMGVDSSGGNMDMGGDEMGGDEMDAADMDMEMAPSGIPLAEGAEDRDGLEMDVLHVALGPLLPHWPAGVVLNCTLQGDVVIAAEASVLDESDSMSVRLGPHERAALCCDHIASLLAVAGWADGQSAAVRVRDALVDEPDAASASRLLDGLERKLRRAWLVRWSLRGLGDLRRIDDPPGTPWSLCGDAGGRLVQLIDRARSEFARTDRRELPWPELLKVAERLVVGLDLAAARLVVASLAIDITSSSALPHTTLRR